MSELPSGLHTRPLPPDPATPLARPLQLRAVSGAQPGSQGVAALILLTTTVLLLGQTKLWEAYPAFVQVRWILLFLFVGVLLHWRVARRRLRLAQWWDAFPLYFIGLALLSAAYSATPSITLQRSFSVALLYLATFWVAWEFERREGVRRLVNLILLPAMATFASGFALIFVEPGRAFQYTGRFQGILINPNSVGILAALCIPLLLVRVADRRPWLETSFLAIASISLVLSGSRGGVIAALAGTLLVTLRARLWRTAIFAFALSIVMFLVTDPGIAWLGDASRSKAASRLARFSTADGGSGRIPTWRIAWKAIKERPVLGHGFGTEDQVFIGVAKADRGGATGTYIHNSYLGLTYQLGFVGSALMYLPLGFLLVAHGRRRRLLGARPTEYDGAAGAVGAGLTAAFFESWLYSVGNAFAFPFWMCVMLTIKHTVAARSVQAKARNNLVRRVA